MKFEFFVIFFRFFGALTIKRLVFEFKLKMWTNQIMPHRNRPLAPVVGDTTVDTDWAVPTWPAPMLVIPLTLDGLYRSRPLRPVPQLLGLVPTTTRSLPTPAGRYQRVLEPAYVFQVYYCLSACIC
jgi:hypothetical protein